VKYALLRSDVSSLCHSTPREKPQRADRGEWGAATPIDAKVNGLRVRCCIVVEDEIRMIIESAELSSVIAFVRVVLMALMVFLACLDAQEAKID
jgi:hypothetical protein